MFNKSELDKWADLYQKAVDDGVFKDAPEPTKPDHFNFLNQPEEASSYNSAEAEYWDRVHQTNVFVDPLEVFNEDYDNPPKPIKPNMSNKELGDVAASKANAANPIEPSSVGKDQDYKPNLADVEELQELHNMKVQLLELQGKLAASDALAKSDDGDKIQKQIDKLQQAIDELSDSITPQFMQSYLS
jgi:chemotaxis protein histidine kinase CheA